MTEEFDVSLLIRGVHPVQNADEPCYLIEAEVDDPDFDWGDITQ